MKSIDLRTTRGVVVLALTLALLAYAGSRHSAAGEGSPADAAHPVRSPQAGAAEAAMAETDLGARIEAAMGGEFAGLWMDPSTARLEVGVTSPEAEAVAKAAAAQVGLEDMMATTPVRSTWLELRAAQERWDRRLWDLLEAGVASTSAVSSRNAVEIELATAVGSSRREEIEQLAAQDAVTVEVVHTSYRRIQVVPEAGRCNEFAPNAANCNPTIVGGVTIKPPKVGATQPACTAGPAVLQKDRKKTPAATETYVLTAGHCIDPARNGGGVGAAWTAYDQAGKGETLGHATAYLHGPFDVGAISVNNETSYWADPKKNSPVEPAVAPWHKNEEHDPLSVVAQTKPAQNVETCLVGQSTGISCGKISNPSVTMKVGGVVMQQLVEVQGATSQGGDSGAPWVNRAKFYAESPANPVAHVEGTHVGSHEANPNRYFQSLEVSLAELKKAHGLDLELLTFFNENRHPDSKRPNTPPRSREPTTPPPRNSQPSAPRSNAPNGASKGR